MKLIVACDPRGGIGYQNKLPWAKIQGDLPRFKQLTEGKIVVMGRNTWESLPKKPLPNRINYIVTSDPGSIPICSSVFPTTIDILKRLDDNACVIGGARLINSSWDYIDTVHLTKTSTEYTCDTFINLIQLIRDYERSDWEQHEDHTYEIWKKK